MSEDRMKHTVVVGCLVRNHEEKVLLIRHHKRGWELPQGRVEEGESLTDAAHREVLEETGIEMELGPLAAVWSKLTPPSALIFTFVARYRGGEPQPSDETPEVGWVAPDEARSMINHPVNRDRLETLLAFTGDVVYRSYTSNPYAVRGEIRWGTGGR